MQTYRLYRTRHLRWIALLGNGMMFAAVTHGIVASPFAPPGLVLGLWGVSTVLITVATALQWWPPSRQVRQQVWSKHPDECIRCGYDIRYCPGPRCPECGEPLPGKQGEQVPHPGGPCVTNKAAPLSPLDLYRFAPWHPFLVACAVVHTLALPFLFVILYGIVSAIGGAARHPGAAVFAIWGSVAVLYALGISLLHIPAQWKPAHRLRAWVQARHPGECVRCGYDVRYCPGPNCPECGEPLGENQGKQVRATSEPRTP